MLHWLRRLTAWNQEQRANGLAGLIALGALGILYLEAPPLPAGADTVRLSSAKSRALQLQPAKPAVQTTAGVPDAVPVLEISSERPLSPQEITERTLKSKIARLKQGRAFLRKTPDYTAQFTKQELVGDELLEEQTIYLKCRHQPFSVYLRWLSGDEGREVLYVDGQHDGQMIVHAGGWKARLPALTISPDSSLAMAESRYPVTKAGILGIIDQILSVHVEDLAKSSFSKCEKLDDQEFDSRKCSTFVLEYKDATVSPTYRKSIVLIDNEWHVPLYVRNFGWPMKGQVIEGDLDEATLIEYYTFTEVQFRGQLAAADFDRANEEYRFR
ncbi:MAG: DUF1571 domain-containing protein [Planctomycetaceae bacterium]|nr:DUF1571 domain-containing protein [Planctomycetaceae bacterium]